MVDKEIKTVEQMSVQDIVDAILHILNTKECTLLNNSDNVIYADEKANFGSNKIVFFIVASSLSGLNENAKETKIREISESLNKYRGKINIISNHTISNDFEQRLLQNLPDRDITFIGRKKLIELLREEYPEFWKHSDELLSGYEDDFLKTEKKDSQLLALKINSEKYDKILDITIQPTLLYFYDDPATSKPIRKSIQIDEIVRDKKSIFIEGISGSGKSTILKRIGCRLIKENHQLKQKNIPVFVSTIDLNTPNFNVIEFVRNKLSKYLGQELDIIKLLNEYTVHLLIDSIDEFGHLKQKNLIKEFEKFIQRFGGSFIIGTRQSEPLEECVSKKTPIYHINNLNIEQIKKFIQSFIHDDIKSNSLLDALRQNKILERIPITPLTLSLLTLLYEEKCYEIPATITDLYDSFHQLIHGRPFVSERLEFIDINFRERILSMYGLYLMRRENHQPLSHSEFISHFIEIFKEKSPDIKGGSIEDALQYIINNTGILYLKDTKWVSFAHPSYMEYYASREIFYYERNSEKEIISNFFDLNWQNVAVFYAGRTKDMPQFAKDINEKAKDSQRLSEYLAVVEGCGYVLQALYLTDNTVKKGVILTVLDKLIECYEAMKKMASDEVTLFKSFNMPILMLLNILHFYEMFNSITLKDAMTLTFDDLMKELKHLSESSIEEERKKIPNIGFKLLNLGLTLSSPQIDSGSQLSDFILNKKVLETPSLLLLADFAYEVLNKNKKEIDKNVRKKLSANSEVNKAFINLPLKKFRFSVLDDIRPDRNVKLIVEGESDVIIIEHAFMVLSDGRMPYWTIEMATTNGLTGSTSSVEKAMECAPTYASSYSQIIGILDCDAAGIHTYNFLNHDYNEIVPYSHKVHKIKSNIHLILLPVPGDMSQYLNKEQELNYFEIEHLFGHEYLNKMGMLLESNLKGEVYKIKDGSKVKTNFAKSVCKEFDPTIFKHFKELFELIDSICGITEIQYIL